MNLSCTILASPSSIYFILWVYSNIFFFSNFSLLFIFKLYLKFPFNISGREDNLVVIS